MRFAISPLCAYPRETMPRAACHRPANARQLRAVCRACAHRACSDSHQTFCHRAVTEAATLNGQTPLHMAAACEQIEVARLLLAAGADASATDEDGSTARELAPSGASADAMGL